MARISAHSKNRYGAIGSKWSDRYPHCKIDALKFVFSLIPANYIFSKPPKMQNFVNKLPCNRIKCLFQIYEWEQVSQEFLITLYMP